MKAPADITYTETMLHEAMEMLEGLKHHMGMFQTQYYGKLKSASSSTKRSIKT